MIIHREGAEEGRQRQRVRHDRRECVCEKWGEGGRKREERGREREKEGKLEERREEERESGGNTLNERCKH